MNKQTYVITFSIMILLLSIGLLHAEVQTLGTKQQYQTINLIQNCINSSYSNISRVVYPNSSYAINVQTAMTKTGDNYGYLFSNTIVLGEYFVYGVCDENGIKVNWVYDFQITPTGGDRLNSLSIFLALLIFALIVLLIGVNMNNGYIGFLAGALFIVSGVYSMIYGIGNLSDTWTRAVAFTIMGIGFMFEVSAGYEIIGDTGFSLGRSSGEEED